MKVNFNFELKAWIAGVGIEADSYDEALEKLYTMTFAELIEEGFEKDSEISDVDGVIIEKTVKVKAYDIEYDIEEDDFENPEDYIGLINSLPSELNVEVTVNPKEDIIEELIADEILFETGKFVKDFKYIIIEEK
jgi:translation initiation factor 2 beta subunit (eIF-2beta)/eIF-5